MGKHDQDHDWIKGMCDKGNECVADLRREGVPRQKAIEECCKQGGHRPGDGHSPARPPRRR